MRINIVGSILGSSGYDAHTRQLVNALYKLNPDIKLDVPLTQDYLNSVNDAELKMIKEPNRLADATIAIMTPPNWRIALADNTKKFIGFCIWEGDKVPEYWIEYLKDTRVDMIFVPSHHTLDAIINTIARNGKSDKQLPKWTNKIHVIPHGVNIDLFKPKDKTNTDIFKVVCNKGWRGGTEDRGGVQYLLKAFTEEFRKGEAIELNLHINPAYTNSVDIKQSMDNLKLNKDSPSIKVSATNIPYVDLPVLYQSADCYVCSTRAESFDLGTAEAMACGIPIITTGFGGQIEHMDNKCSCLIDYKLESVKGDIMYEEIHWATPNIRHLQKLLRQVFTNRKTTRQMGKCARKFISDWTWENSAKKALELLKI